MKTVKYLAALWAGILIYASLAILFGSMGFSAYQQLETEKLKQEANMENLKKINRELENTMKSLLYDEDTLTVYAREQGYGSPREKFIRIVGLGGNRKIRTVPGDLIIAAEPQYIADRTLIIIAFFMGISIFVCMAFFDFMKYLRER